MELYKNNVLIRSGQMRDRNVGKKPIKLYKLYFSSNHDTIDFIAFLVIYCHSYPSFRLPFHIIALDDMHTTDISSENNV